MAVSPILQLMDSGNLVLTKENDENPQKYLRQSFDCPIDTLLSEVKLGWNLKPGLNRGLSALKNSKDLLQATSHGVLSLAAIQKMAVIPESVLKKQKGIKEWVLAKKQDINAAKTACSEERKLTHKRAELYAKEYIEQAASIQID